VLYALHDALMKPMPGCLYTPSLAESWTSSKDGLSYEFVLRKGARFHNGEPVTAEDVKFSFERYRGAGAKLLKEKVRQVHYELSPMAGVSGRAEQAGIGLIPGYPYSAPYEDLQLKKP
jgi:ABC-type transport system substrate-binding protein